MAKKQKNMTLSGMAAFSNGEINKIDVFDDGRLVLDVKHVIGYDDAVKFVDDIVDMTVGKDRMDYFPERMEFARRAAVMKYYAGTDMGDSIEKAYDAMFDTDIFNAVLCMVDEAQVAGLMEAAGRKIRNYVDVQNATGAMEMRRLINTMETLRDSANGMMKEIGSEEFKKMYENVLQLQ